MHFLLIFCVLIASQLPMSASKLVKLDTFPRASSLQINDWEFGSGFYISNNYFAQQVSVAFDLESPHTLLYDANYISDNDWPPSAYHDYFRPQDSISFATKNQSFKLSFESDTQQIKTSVEGYWAEDTIFQLFDQSSSAYKNSGFGLVQGGEHFQAENTIFAYTGRLGMSLNGTSNNWLVQAMKKDYGGLITFLIFDNMYALYLGIDPSQIGNCDASKALDEPVVDTTPQLGKQFWQIKVTRFAFGKYSFTIPQFVRFTLSTAYLYGPQDYVKRIRDTLNAHEEQGRWIVNCVDDGKRPTMFFTTSTGRIEIPPSVYVLKDEEANKCYLAVTAFTDSAETNHWAFGALFQSQYCLTLDYINQKVKIQPAKSADSIILRANRTVKKSAANEFMDKLMMERKH